jgi:L-methionine (R)-S-oxide reductase
VEGSTKRDRYTRIQAELGRQFAKTADFIARMATAVALLHHKMAHFSWTGTYLLRNGDLVVGPYQGTIACPVLRPAHTGVCWACVDRGEPLVVADVRTFPGHIACDPRSRSELVVPLRDVHGVTVGVLDVDSMRSDAFDDTDLVGLVAVVGMLTGSTAV